MKKFLSLVLALVMTMSLVTVAGAKDFTDADKVTYTEAVDVISALEIVGGYADGSFNPTGTLTRGAAAKIICNILVGPKAAAELKAVEAPFADVAADNVFAGYIAYCVNEGIIAGYGDGNFGPANPLTGYAFLKMLLTSLGYDQTAEGYVGANAQVNILLDAKKVIDANGDETSLIAGLEGTFNGAKAITREEACLFALNALQAKKVSYDEDRTNIKIGEIEISTGLGDADADGELLYTYNFEKLTPDYEAHDELGLPATTWTIDGEEEAIGTYAKKADLVVKNYAEEQDLYKLMGKKEATEWGYGEKDETPVVADGQIAYFYYDTTTPIFVETIFGEVTAVVEDDAEDEDDVAYAVITALSGVLAGEEFYFETDKLAEEDLVIFYQDKLNTNDDYDYVAYNVSAPKSVDGVITSVKGGEYIKVDGKKEVLSLNVFELDADVDYTVAGEDTYTFYYDYAGAIIAVDMKAEAEETYNYAWVIDREVEVAGSNLLNSKKDTAKVKVLFLDGTVEVIDYEIAYATKAGDGLAKDDPYFVLNGAKVALAGFEGAIDVDTFYAFTKTAKGYTFRSIDDAKVTGATAFDVVNAYTKEDKTFDGWNLTAASKFVTVGEDGSVVTKTGYKNIEDVAAGTSVLVLHAKESTKATAIYTVVEEDTTTETVNYAYFVEAGEANKDGNVECTFYVGGKKVTYWCDDYAAQTLGMVFDLTIDDGVATMGSRIYTNVTGELTVLDDAYMIVDGSELEFAKEYEVYQVSLNKKTLTKATLAEEKNVTVYLNGDGDVALVLINHANNAFVAPTLAASIWLKDEWTCSCPGEDNDGCTGTCNSFIAVGADAYEGATAAAGELAVILYNAEGEVLAEAVNVAPKAALGQVNFYTCGHDSSSWDGNYLAGAEEFEAVATAKLFYQGIEIASVER